MSKFESFCNILIKFGIEVGVNFFDLIKDGVEWGKKALSWSVLVASTPLVLIGALCMLIIDAIKGDIR